MIPTVCDSCGAPIDALEDMGHVTMGLAGEGTAYIRLCPACFVSVRDAVESLIRHDSRVILVDGEYGQTHIDDFTGEDE